jgi:hypothetical protein
MTGAMRIDALLCGSLAVLALAGCAGAGETAAARGKPPEEVALIRGTQGPVHHNLLVLEVDGEKFHPARAEVKLAPGRHRVTLIYWDMVHCIPLLQCLSPTSYAYILTADLEAAQGRVYEAEGEGTYAEPHMPIRLRITDELTDEIVWTGEAHSRFPNLIMR